MAQPPPPRKLSSAFSDSYNNLSELDCSGKTVISVSRDVTVPDQVRVDRCYRLPEYGPRILFFSGGSAIRGLSIVLKSYTHNSIHLITPFDSGGSSAEIRKHLDMLSVGDLRNRLTALSDDTSLGNPAVVALFSFRLNKCDVNVAKSEFGSILSGKHDLVANVSMPMRSILISHLRWFASRMPYNFDLCGASIGNLIITGCFLEHDRDIVTAIFLIWTLLGVRGCVRPLTGANLHIRTLYEDGTEEVGQHKIGKAEMGLHGKIVKIDFVESLETSERQEAHDCVIDTVSADLVASADLIVYPCGSFFGSLLVNICVQGAGKAIAARNCPKIYIPNTDIDPEMYGYSIAECAGLIVEMVRVDAGNVPVSSIIQYILVDTQNCEYCVPIEEEKITMMGIQLIDVVLVEDGQTESKKKSKLLSPNKLVEVLVSLGA
uniref:Gluconeogenesis factor n=1 Tax=Odontella aurita TaxID=265563 RepID=A0A7S4M706_9STRA|mmetsp:Transcript_12525/g.36978  ORF Transcript_12525/g.36978 Transcript_12525/m.36978 type:complete len:433 (+) Transcript_12525:168-1466(+)|eukprot:CAMPEP_0113545098 /NCGR_PEP_ID=MMETSP0015_2-20120614/11074_1 /TAXON_ID=2838 /ORGANISM="Odontella" /LENGTH=432 /DNA_ID=CAMNT_0000445429 /DNA_START=127 /DNA_END=1425 /DNA_ORIENTATION=+ /assembly_acc=CAM_ASM_000160